MMLEVGRQAKELGFTDLGVTGGETFVQPHMPEVLAQMADLLPTVALTNATLFSRRLLDRVAPLAGRDIALQISLDRLTPTSTTRCRPRRPSPRSSPPSLP